ADFESETRLTDAARTDQTNQSHGRIGKPLLQKFDIALATEQRGWRKGQRPRTRSVECRIGSESPRAGDQRVTGLTLQIERRRERTHGLNVRPPSFAALQRADCLNGYTRD